jgi:hypothetical protein
MTSVSVGATQQTLTQLARVILRESPNHQCLGVGSDHLNYVENDAFLSPFVVGEYTFHLMRKSPHQCSAIPSPASLKSLFWAHFHIST